MTLATCSCVRVQMEIRWYPIVQRPLFQIEMASDLFLYRNHFSGLFGRYWICIGATAVGFLWPSAMLAGVWVRSKVANCVSLDASGEKSSQRPKMTREMWLRSRNYLVNGNEHHVFPSRCFSLERNVQAEHRKSHWWICLSQRFVRSLAAVA